jgi:hypothetical protein
MIQILIRFPLNVSLGLIRPRNRPPPRHSLPTQVGTTREIFLGENPRNMLLGAVSSEGTKEVVLDF